MRLLFWIPVGIFLLIHALEINSQLLGDILGGSIFGGDGKRNNEDEGYRNRDLVRAADVWVRTDSSSRNGHRRGGRRKDPQKVNCGDYNRPAYVSRVYRYSYRTRDGKIRYYNERRRFWLKPVYIIQWHKLKSDSTKVHYIRRRLYKYPAPSKYRSKKHKGTKGGMIRKKPGRYNSPKSRSYHCDIRKDSIISLKRFKAKYSKSFEQGQPYQEWAETNRHRKSEVNNGGYGEDFSDKKSRHEVTVFEDIDTSRRASDAKGRDEGEDEPDPSKPPKFPEGGTYEDIEDAYSMDEDEPDDPVGWTWAMDDEPDNGKSKGRKKVGEASVESEEDSDSGKDSQSKTKKNSGGKKSDQLEEEDEKGSKSGSKHKPEKGSKNSDEKLSSGEGSKGSKKPGPRPKPRPGAGSSEEGDDDSPEEDESDKSKSSGKKNGPNADDRPAGTVSDTSKLPADVTGSNKPLPDASSSADSLVKSKPVTGDSDDKVKAASDSAGSPSAGTSASDAAKPVAALPDKTDAAKPVGDLPEKTDAAKPAGDLPGKTDAAKPVGDLPGITDGVKPVGDLPGITDGAKPVGDLPGKTDGAKPVGDLPEKTDAAKPVGDLPGKTDAAKPVGDLPEKTDAAKPIGHLPEKTGSPSSPASLPPPVVSEAQQGRALRKMPTDSNEKTDASKPVAALPEKPDAAQHSPGAADTSGATKLADNLPNPSDATTPARKVNWGRSGGNVPKSAPATLPDTPDASMPSGTSGSPSSPASLPPPVVSEGQQGRALRKIPTDSNEKTDASKPVAALPEKPDAAQHSPGAADTASAAKPAPAAPDTGATKLADNLPNPSDTTTPARKVNWGRSGGNVPKSAPAPLPNTSDASMPSGTSGSPSSPASLPPPALLAPPPVVSDNDKKADSSGKDGTEDDSSESSELPKDDHPLNSTKDDHPLNSTKAEPVNDKNVSSPHNNTEVECDSYEKDLHRLNLLHEKDMKPSERQKKHRKQGRGKKRQKNKGRGKGREPRKGSGRSISGINSDLDPAKKDVYADHGVPDAKKWSETSDMGSQRKVNSKSSDMADERAGSGVPTATFTPGKPAGKNEPGG